MEKEFFSQLDNPLLGKAFKLAIIGEWLAANSLDVNFIIFNIQINLSKEVIPLQIQSFKNIGFLNVIQIVF